MTLLAFIREHRQSENVIFFSVSSTKRPHDAFNQEIKKSIFHLFLLLLFSLGLRLF